MTMPATIAWKNASIPKIKDKVYILKDNGILELEKWSGNYVEPAIIQIGTKNGIPVVRYLTMFDVTKKNMSR